MLLLLPLLLPVGQGDDVGQHRLSARAAPLTTALPAGSSSTRALVVVQLLLPGLGQSDDVGQQCLPVRPPRTTVLITGTGGTAPPAAWPGTSASSAVISH